MSAVDNALHDACVIPQVDEGQVLAVLAPTGHPTAERHLPPDIRYLDRPAVPRAHRRRRAKASVWRHAALRLLREPHQLGNCLW